MSSFHFWAIIVTGFCWTVYWGTVLNFVSFVQCNHPVLLGNRCVTCLHDDVFVSLFPVHHRDPNDNGWEDISNSIRRGQPYQIIHLLLNFNADRGVSGKDGKTVVELVEELLVNALVVGEEGKPGKRKKLVMRKDSQKQKIIRLLKSYESLRKVPSPPRKKRRKS